MASSLLALLDDIYANLSDVGLRAKAAGQKTTGVIGRPVRRVMGKP